MSKHIRAVRIEDLSVDPAQAMLRIEVELEAERTDIEVLGRLMGPRCLFSSTVEIAYPLRPLPGSGGERCRRFRVVIPEPSLWDPQSPFLYQGPVEVWDGGQRREAVQLSHGLRSLTLGPRGLRLNGQPLMLHGVHSAEVGAAELVAWRSRGVNLLVAPIDESAALLLDLADRHGFLVVGRVADAAAAALAARLPLEQHASWLGWVGSVPRLSGIRFHICSIDQVEEMTSQGVPLLVTADAPPRLPGALGWIEP